MPPPARAAAPAAATVASVRSTDKRRSGRPSRSSESNIESARNSANGCCIQAFGDHHASLLGRLPGGLPTARKPCPGPAPITGSRTNACWILDLAEAARGEPAMPPTHAHFNGSVNLADAESVMREIASRVPAGLRRVPDGETGDRSNWIFFQMQKFMQMPSWCLPAPAAEDGDYSACRSCGWPTASTRPRWNGPISATPTPISTPTRPSPRCAAEGVIPPGVALPGRYPTPLASIGGYIVPEQQPLLPGSYEQAMFADLDRLLARSRMTRWPYSGTWRWSSACSRRRSGPAARRPST